MDRQPHKPAHFLAGIAGEGLLMRQDIVEVSSIPEHVIFGGVAEPFESVGKYGESRITYGWAFHRPAVVTDHDFEQREALLAPANEEVPRKFRHRDHHAGLPHQPFVIRAVIHDPGRPGKRAFHARRYPSAENKTEITKPFFRVHHDLFFADRILSEGAVFEKQTRAVPGRDIWSAILIEANQFPRRWRGLPGLGSINRVLK